MSPAKGLIIYQPNDRIKLQLSTRIDIRHPDTGASETVIGIWDTGATGSCVTERITKKLNLTPTGITKVMGVHGVRKGGNMVYVATVTINNTVSFTGPVIEVEELSGGADFLIGMDIITRGDLVINNYQGKTTMTFRTPSIGDIDIIPGGKAKALAAIKQPQTSQYASLPNGKCSCGSNKNFRHCHGKLIP